jgi:hypothetical protein
MTRGESKYKTRRHRRCTRKGIAHTLDAYVHNHNAFNFCGLIVFPPRPVLMNCD